MIRIEVIFLDYNRKKVYICEKFDYDRKNYSDIEIQFLGERQT